MVAYNVVTAICLALLTLSAVYVLVSVIRKKRADRITFIRGFKRGKCIAIFLIAIPLLSIAYIYDGATVINGILSGIDHVVNLVVLKFSVSKVGALLNDNLFYKITFYYCCVMVILNAILFAFSLIGQQVWQSINVLSRLFTRKDKLYLFGNNQNNLSVYKSNKKCFAAVVDKIPNKDGLELYKKKIKYFSCDSYGGAVSAIVKGALKGKNYTVVINTQDDEKNLCACNLFVDKIAKCDQAQKRELFNRLRIFVFGDPKYEAVYGDVVTAACGCIRYKNKYRMLATDFIDRYPLTSFMDERHVDYSTSLIKPNVDINVCMIGFGKPNRQIFLTSVANNQFLTKTENGVSLKQVNYHIFDKNAAENNKNLNHLYYRFKNECKDINGDDYLPLPALPATEKYYHLDVNSPDFYNDIRKVVSKSANDVNVLIVSFESDLENIDMAQKLVEKRREWGVDNLVIFVRVTKSHTDHFIFREEKVYFIGNESECVYDIERITGDKIYKMAQMRNEIYDLEYKITSDKNFVVSEEAVIKNRGEANEKWYISKSQLERESSLYCCLSLRSKLNLMGLDYCKTDENELPALTEEEYLNRYAVGDLPDTKTYNLDIEGKKVINYTLNFPQSKRRNLAVLEHLRWNSFMISKGMVPATKEQILTETVEKGGKRVYTNGKNYRLRRHGNITTFEGLIKFRQMVAERDKKTELECDVIKYDYQLLDDAFWLLSKNGYKIVERK